MEYRGILRLYTNYEACLDIKADMEYRIMLKDSAYNMCVDNLGDCTEQLNTTNTRLQLEIEENSLLNGQNDRLKRQRNYAILGGASILGALLLIIFAG